MNMLLEMLSKCPRYLSHGPAAEMWSVVHFPFTLIRTESSFKSLLSQVSNGSNNCKRWLLGSTSTCTAEPSYETKAKLLVFNATNMATDFDLLCVVRRMCQCLDQILCLAIHRQTAQTIWSLCHQCLSMNRSMDWSLSGQQCSKL